MAEKREKYGTTSQIESTAVPIHRRLTDAGQFSFAALCALTLRKLFEDECQGEFNKMTISYILRDLEQPKQVQESILAIFDGQGSENPEPFIDILLSEDVLQGDVSPIISELVGFAIAQGNYDARVRVMIKHIAWKLRVGYDIFEEIECDLAESLNTDKYEMSEEEKLEQEKKAQRRKFKRYALIGLATVTGGTLIGLTGGLAAPLVAAGAGVIIGGAGAAALGSVAGVAIIGSLFGVAGAGLTGYKMKRRVGAIEEFVFDPLVSEGPLQVRNIRKQLHVIITVTGWIDNKMLDFKFPWKNLIECQEQYTLRWESHYLLQLGQAFDYIFNTAVSMATSEALKYTVLSGLMAAIAWPAALLSVSNVIDNPWSVSMQRSVTTGRQLAEVLLAREQGKRPVSLIGYSLGARVIFYCLVELAKRKGSEGIVEDVVLLGAPVTSDRKSWAAFQNVVSGKIINGYCKGDWLLKFLYRTASVQLHIAGLEPIMWDNRRMQNINLSEVVTGHLDYMNQLDTILRVVGIRVRDSITVKTSSSFMSSFSNTDASKDKLVTSTCGESDMRNSTAASSHINSTSADKLVDTTCESDMKNSSAAHSCINSTSADVLVDTTCESDMKNSSAACSHINSSSTEKLVDITCECDTIYSSTTNEHINSSSLNDESSSTSHESMNNEKVVSLMDSAVEEYFCDVGSNLLVSKDHEVTREITTEEVNPFQTKAQNTSAHQSLSTSAHQNSSVHKVASADVAKNNPKSLGKKFKALFIRNKYGANTEQNMCGTSEDLSGHISEAQQGVDNSCEPTDSDSYTSSDPDTEDNNDVSAQQKLQVNYPV